LQEEGLQLGVEAVLLAQELDGARLLGGLVARPIDDPETADADAL
jgi:hypothetical protein